MEVEDVDWWVFVIGAVDERNIFLIFLMKQILFLFLGKEKVFVEVENTFDVVEEKQNERDSSSGTDIHWFWGSITEVFCFFKTTRKTKT